MSNMRGAIAGVLGGVNEAVIKPVSDEVGQALEAGVKTVISGPPPTPSLVTQKQQEEKKQEEEKGLAEARYKISWWQRLQQEQRTLQYKDQQVKSQDTHQEEQQKKEKAKVKQFEIQKKKESGALAARNTTEKRKGVCG